MAKLNHLFLHVVFLWLLYVFSFYFLQKLQRPSGIFNTHPPKKSEQASGENWLATYMIVYFISSHADGCVTYGYDHCRLAIVLNVSVSMHGLIRLAATLWNTFFVNVQ